MEGWVLMIVEAFIEIPRGSQNKYEYDSARGVFRLDRVFHSPIRCPTEYGFIPGTLAEDGDELDILLLVTEPTFPGCLIPARVLGALEMRDQKGLDMKILAVPVNDPRFEHLSNMDDVPPHLKREIEYFFEVYKELEGHKTEVHGWKGAEEAYRLVEQARAKTRG